MGCNCKKKRKAMMRQLAAGQFRRAGRVARSGVHEMVTGEDDGVLEALEQPAAEAESS